MDIIFFIVGMWALIAGKLPGSLLRLLFGKGEFAMSTRKVRGIGLLLALPFSVSLAFIMFSALFHVKNNLGFMSVLEIFLLIAVSVLVIVMVRESKVPASAFPVNQPPLQPDSLPVTNSVPVKQESSYGKKILLIVGLVILSMFVLGNLLTIFLSILLIIQDFALFQQERLISDGIFFGINILVVGLAIFGIVKLIKKLIHLT